MDLREIIAVIRTRWFMLVIATVIGGLLALAGSLLITPTYKATVDFYVTTAAGEGAAAAYQGSLGAQQRVQSYAALVKSREITEKVIEVAEVDLDADQVAESITSSADSKTVILGLSVDDTIPERAVRIAQGYAEILPEIVNNLETPDGGGPALAKLTVINPASLSSDLVSPKTTKNVILGIIFGFMLGVGIVILTHLMDRRVKSDEQIEKITQKPIIGSIPFRKEVNRRKEPQHIIPFREGYSPAAEAFRRLRTNLRFLNVDNPARMFVLTSSAAMEGKSETAINLAIALGEAGNRTLLVEADLRRPRVVHYMSMADKVGLTNILSGEAALDEVVQETRHEGVYLLACGPLPPNPSELLSSEVIQDLCSEARKEYDYVIFDSPPLIPVTDAALLARIADGALLVVRSGRTTSDQVMQSVNNIHKANANLLGIITVANKPVKRKEEGNYYYQSAGSHIR